MITLIKKEISYYLNNPVGYIIVALFGVFANFLFVKDIFLNGSASMKPFFGLLPWLFMVFVPAITMRSLSEEKRVNTIETLLSFPISEAQIVIAKFISLVILISAALLLTVGLPVSLSFLSGLYLPELLVGYLGAILLGASFAAMSLLFSSLTKNQVVAFLISVTAIFALVVISTDFAASTLPKFVIDNATLYSPVYHLQNFAKGVIDLRSVFYFLSFISLCCFLTIIDLEKRS